MGHQTTRLPQGLFGGHHSLAFGGFLGEFLLALSGI
jgi:hypothetical protein